MEDFKFTDRPDLNRLSLSISEFADPNTDVKATELFLDLQWTYREMQKTYDQVLAESDLTETRFIILMFLFRAKDYCLSPSELATKLGAKRPTVTKILNRLMDRGWVVKLSAPNDKRSILIQLTSPGKDVLQQFLPRNFKAVQIIMDALSPDEITTLSSLLKKINTGTNKLNLEEDIHNGNN